MAKLDKNSVQTTLNGVNFTPLENISQSVKVTRAQKAKRQSIPQKKSLLFIKHNGFEYELLKRGWIKETEITRHGFEVKFVDDVIDRILDETNDLHYLLYDENEG